MVASLGDAPIDVERGRAVLQDLLGPMDCAAGWLPSR